MRRLVVALALLLALPAAAGELPRHPVGPLQEVIYGYAVIEYCGLASTPVSQGYDLQRRWTIASLGLSPAQVKLDDHRANLAADYQYGNHGLGGFRSWCRDEGLPAAQRFLQFRETVLGQ